MSIDHEADIDVDVTDHCSWWVLSANYPTSGSVHVPRSALSQEGNDPDEQPPAETLCRIGRRRNTTWKVRSHAQLPPGYRPTCRKCLERIQEVLEL